jgi:hypothetical protein
MLYILCTGMSHVTTPVPIMHTATATAERAAFP